MAHDDQKTPTGTVISPAKLAHVVLLTPNYQSMVSFYKSFLGAHASFENDKIAFLTYDDEHHRIAIVTVPGVGPKAQATAGLHHIAFTFNTLDDLVLAYQQRKALGILPVWSINHGPTTSMYYQDPDGNKLETQVDNFATTDEENAYMMSDEFAENPIGVDFDPEELIRRLKSGEDPENIKRRPNIGPRSFGSVPVA